MSDPNQYLRLDLDGSSFLLPSTVRYTIEQRDGLAANRSPDSNVVAWRAVKTGRWPAYGLDAGLKPLRRDEWQRAVFLESMPAAVGIAVDDVHLMPRGETPIAPFVPPGPMPTRHGHLFNGAWVAGRDVTLVLDPKVLILYLQGLGD